MHPLSTFRGFSAAELLWIWEAGSAQHPLDRTLTILAAAEPGQSRQVLARLPIGRRDARLLAVHERAFGRRLAARAACPACAEGVEMALDARDLLASWPEDDLSEPLLVARDGYEVRCRPPDSYDLAAIVEERDVLKARRRLLARCVVAATRAGEATPPEELPEAIVAAVAERIAAHDPLAVIELTLACPACGHEWQMLFDIGAFLWSKIEAAARRLLHQVHTLARAYGWSEAEILALGPVRRQAYLELI